MPPSCALAPGRCRPSGRSAADRNLVTHESVHLEPLIVGDQNLLAALVEIEDPFVDVDDGIDEGPLRIEAGRVDEVAHRLAESQHERLFGRVDGEQRAGDHDQQHDHDGEEGEAGERRLHLAAPAGFGLQGVERQIGHRRAHARGVEDRLVHRAEDMFHRLEIEAFPGDAGRILVLRIDLIEPRGLADRFGDRLLAVALRREPDPRRLTLRLGHDLVGVFVRFVDRGLQVLLGGGHVAIGGQHLRRGVDQLQLDLEHEHARLVGVEDALHPLLDVGLDRLAVAGQDAVDRLQSDDLAHHALGDRLHGLLGMTNVEHEILGLGRIDLPDHAELDIDDVQVARQHQALFGRLRAVAAGLAAGVHFGAIADLGDLLIGDGHLDHIADRPGPVVVEPRDRLAGVAAEDEIDADLVGLHRIEAEGEPKQNHHEDQESDPAAGEAAAAARQEAAQGVLKPTQRLFEIPWCLPAARPRAPRPLPRPPRAAALIVPGHETSCRADARLAAPI